jgi:hypothetical protein
MIATTGSGIVRFLLGGAPASVDAVLSRRELQARVRGALGEVPLDRARQAVAEGGAGAEAETLAGARGVEQRRGWPSGWLGSKRSSREADELARFLPPARGSRSPGRRPG